MLIYESFIRRASELKLPFMLKGSYLSRQYFPDPEQRIPGDLDWLYMERLEDPETSRTIFDQWLMGITEQETTDGVKFRDFRENAFWRRIDYAMSDDFPTVNTDLTCWVDDELVDVIGLDISFNLPVDYPPVPLLYKPLRGEPFTIPYTVPIALQVSWKIHQTLVRPRFKDLFDLTYLLKHPSFNKETFDQAIKALVKECNTDNLSVYRLQFFLYGEMDRLFEGSIRESWDGWRHDISSPGARYMFYERAADITDAKKLPYNLSEFLHNFYVILTSVGFEPTLLDSVVELFKNTNGYVERVNYTAIDEKSIAISKWSQYNEDDNEDRPDSEVVSTGQTQQQSDEKQESTKEDTWLNKLRHFFRGKS